MSASLVGSEMCIRDRLCRWRHPDLAMALHGVPPPSCQKPGPGPLRRDGPVSYTHLTLPTICSV
eukprot:5256690-Alexandrium_andersonii.AAC.1